MSSIRSSVDGSDFHSIESDDSNIDDQNLNEDTNDVYDTNTNDNTKKPTQIRSSSYNRNRDPIALNHSSKDEDNNTQDGLSSPPIAKLPSTATLSRKNTSMSFDKTKFVPRDKRRGIGAKFTLVPEYENPRELPSNVKYSIVLIIGICAIVGPMGTSIILPAIDSVADDLKTTVTMVDISVGIYLLSLGIAPLWWSNFSERHGRRSIYLISFTLFTGFSIGCAEAKSIGMLIAFRILSGACSASVQAVGAGTVGDLYDMRERGKAMGIFYLGPLTGPLLAPIIGGALATKSWRATQWFLVAMAGFCVVLVFFFLPETLRMQDNREAVRKILRERRKNRAVEKDEETKVDSEVSADANTLDEHTDALEAAEQQQEEERELDRVVSNLSRRTSRSYQNIQNEDEEEEIVDPTLPGLIKTTTAQSQKMKNYELNKLRSRVELAATEEEQQQQQHTNEQFQTDEKQNEHSKKTKWQIFKQYSYIYGYSPLKSLKFFQYPPILLAIAYSAICFSILYFVNFTISYSYPRAPYNFSEVIVGLMYIPNSVTYIIASIWGGKYNDMLLEKKRKKYGILAPEARFGWNVVLAVILFPISLLIIGWCLDQKEFWITPLVGTALFGFASMLVIGTTVTYLVDCLPGRGATGIALSNVVRMILATIASFVTEPLIRAMGVGPLFSMLAGIIFLITGILLILKKKGDYWRENYDLEKLYDSVDD